jgi:hypothetical protein
MRAAERELTIDELNLVSGGINPMISSGHIGGISWAMWSDGSTSVHWSGDAMCYMLDSKDGFSERPC